MDILNMFLDIVFGNGSVFQNITIALVGIGLLLLFMRLWRNTKGVAPAIQKTSRVIFIGSLVLNVVLVGFINFARQNIEEIQAQSLFVCASMGTESEACKGVRVQEGKALTRKLESIKALEKYDEKLAKVDYLANELHGKSAKALADVWKVNLKEVERRLNNEKLDQRMNAQPNVTETYETETWPEAPVSQYQ